MKLSIGIITEKLTESKQFYTELLGFGVRHNSKFYILLHTPDKKTEISFLVPDHPSEQPLFHKPFNGQGVYLTIEVEVVDVMYLTMKQKNVPIEVELRDELWGDRHFAIKDPNGIGIDIVTYSPQ